MVLPDGCMWTRVLKPRLDSHAHELKCSYDDEAPASPLTFSKATPLLHLHPLASVCRSPHASPTSSHSVPLFFSCRRCAETHTFTLTNSHTHSDLLPLTFSCGQMQSLLPLSATFEVSVPVTDGYVCGATFGFGGELELEGIQYRSEELILTSAFISAVPRLCGPQRKKFHCGHFNLSRQSQHRWDFYD